MKRTSLFLLLFSILLLLSGCKDKNQSGFSKYIAGYTNGVIKSSSAVSIILNQAPDKGLQPGSTLPAKTLQIKPAIKGEVVLKDNNRIEFLPSERFKNGQAYTVTFNLGSLCEVPKEYQEFHFEFKVIPLTIVYERGEVLTEPDAPNQLQYQGILQSSDETETSAVERMVKATYSGQDVSPEWTHDGNRHYFTIRNLIKSDEDETLSLRFDKSVKNNGKAEVIIPGKNNFTVLNVKASDNIPPVISVYMSQNIDPAQNLQGLVGISDVSSVNCKVSGNIIYIYPPSDLEETDITVNLRSGIRSVSGNTLREDFIRTVQGNPAEPQIKLIGKGVIVPGDNQVLIPFSAIALKAVDLEIIQVFNQNMNFFLQDNLYDGAYQLASCARPVFMKKIDLQKDHPDADLNRWNDFTVNLKDLVKLEKGTVYRINLKFKKSYTTLSCSDELPDSDYGTRDWDNPEDYYYYDEYPSGYEWDKRNDPCHVSYYNSDRFESRNIINTSLGLMAKRGADNSYCVSVSDLGTAEAVANCEISLYNYQNQKIDSAQTDKNGFANLHPDNKAYILVARKGKDKAWLRMNDGSALSLSNFDVSGQHVQMGVKGFIYGERGVWRPGDEIYLSLILEDKMHVLPDGHPIVAQLTDPNGNIVQSLKDITGKNNIHCFTFKTDDDAQTGYWHAIFKIGGLTFTKTLRVEAIKPNRLAIQLEFPNDKIIGKGVSTAPVNVSTRWLNGAPTSRQKAITEVRLYNTNKGFSEFPDYTFSDKSRYFEATTETLFDGTSNSDGSFSFNLKGLSAENAPGLLNASFTTRVFETGGDFSITTQSLLYSPYTEYVGIRLPESEDNWYSTRSAVRLSGVTVTPKGKKSGSSTIEIEVYKLNWHWWWDSQDENLGSYVNREYSESVLTKRVKAVDGSFSADLDIDRYGRYCIKATDPSGHTSGIIAWFGSWGESNQQETATMLRVNTDKKSYRVGENIKVTLPSSKGAVAIVSTENGKTIHDIRRIETTESTTTFELPATGEMCPNTYISVSLIQPHANRQNDRPIRLYGVVNVNVEDPALHLHPQAKVPAELHPGRDFTVEVNEKDGKAMNYTIAVVDEGLLSITTFRTPDPFPVFYAREALGVKTWDFYDYIYGAYGARLDKAFAVGGDESLNNKQDEKTNRFKPVVLFAGPFSLKEGKTARHTFRMPEYIGEVRTMVVAATNGKYGSADASSTVSKPLMVSVALPRMFTPGDITDIPVTVFAMKDNIRDVEVTMTTDDKITLTGNSTRKVHFDKIGEQVVYFKARINKITGISTLRTTAVSGNETATVTEDITVRVPNPRITLVEEKEAKAGESVSFDATVSGDRPQSVLEISSIPPLNLEQRLNYLLEYPHGCAEQITSQAFPQLSLPYLLALSTEQQMKAESQIREVINRLRSYQTSEGGFAYWSGQPYASEWVTAYVTEFLVSAQQQGYTVPLQMLQNAVTYLKQTTNSWSNRDPWSQFQQSYRLYVLALAGKPDMAAMNRLKENRLERPLSQWLLAAAYALSNQQNTADNLVNNLSTDFASYRETGGTYGSTTRDNALLLQCMVTLDRQQDAYRILQKISRAMGSREWYSTQETAFALHAAAQYVQKYLGTQKGIHILVTTPQGKQNIETDRTIWQLPLTLENGKAIATVENKGEGNLFVRQINSSAPFEVVTEKVMSGMTMEARYYNDKGESIDIHRVKQGEDITTEITVRNTGVTGTYQELALSYLLPSGFEIINERLTGNATWQGAENVDIRDDRFYVYFSLDQNASKTFKFRCNAAFRGEYMLPAINCSAMYDNSIQAVLPGGKMIIE